MARCNCRRWRDLIVAEHALSRFVLEAQAVNKIGHANIVDIFSFGTLGDGRSYFAMEWLGGETLGQRLTRSPLPAREAIVILLALCRALEAAHAAGVIHRDLKPDNVFLAFDDEGWRVKLLDFGIAKLSTATTSVSRTATGVALGTPLYMAPEQARGEAVDGRTDVYALGLLAYAAVCGESLFEDEGSAVEILAAHINKPPRSPRVRVPDISGAFEQLILDMIAKQPDHRPAVVEVRQRLAAIAATLAQPAMLLPPGPLTIRASPELLQGARTPTLPAATPAVLAAPPALPAATPSVSDPAEADEIILPRRSRWPLAVVAVAMLAASVAVVVSIRRPGAPRAALPETRLAVTPTAAPKSPTPVAAVVVAAPAPVGRTPSAPDGAEFVVEPALARLAVDGHPVALVGGRASLALAPGDHVALATLGARSASKRFAVTADHAATVSLRVPVADPHVVPPSPPPTGDDVDAVQDPFHR